MDSAFTILIADRNRHVREFLRRELIGEGYHIRLAKSDREVLDIIDQESPDLLILDLEIPYAGGLAILESIQNREPPLPVVIHTFLTEYANHPAIQGHNSFVEKAGNTDCLKAAVQETLQRYYPQRVEAMRAKIERGMEGKYDKG